MKIVLTGAGGFIGHALQKALSGDHEMVGIDRQLNGAAGIEGDLCDRATLDTAFANGCDAVIHLATVPGGAAEADPDLARRVNLDATMALIETAGRTANRPRFIFASSIAVFGNPLPPRVDDATVVAPMMLYGAHKALMETWIETQTRRGAISGLSLRFPGVIARPKGPSGMKSAFMSDVFHALRAAAPIELPVSPDATMWLMSVSQMVANLVQALETSATGTITLPALRVSMRELVEVIAQATKADPALASYAPDPALEAGFGRMPPLATPAADALGFSHDGNLDALVEAALATLS